ncbi:hypothetical protein VL10_20780 [Leclercia adecarboxylata]|nr:hypothetical protein VL10_20780 [Leclercia adecarboxylata]KMN64115.1 hypothetical protein VK95_16495 [Leclercia sp. LK8]
MVEKVLEIKHNASMDIEAEPDNDALLEWIDKKKKQNELDGNELPPATVTTQMLVQLLNRSVGGGGFKIADDNTKKALLAQDTIHRLPAGERRLLRTAGSVVEQIAKAKGETSVQTGQQPAVQSRQTTKNAVLRSVSPTITSPLMDIFIEEPVTKPLIRAAYAPKRKEVQQLTLQAGKTQDVVPGRQHEVSHQQSYTPATQHQMKKLLVAQHEVDSGVKGARNLELDYSFRSWTGEHSVKVTVPTEGNITMLPSDPRAAYALSRHMSQLTGLTPELLQPGKDSDEQRKQQHAQQDEEQE